MIKKPALVFLLLLPGARLPAQVTVEQVIAIAKANSDAVKSINNDKKLATLSYNSFRASLRPALSLYGNAPVYNKDNYAVTQPDGTIKFLPRSQNYSNIGIGFSQPVPFTGGTISVNTDLYRFDDFTAGTKQYNGTPFFLRLTQPLFGYNAYKWDKQIVPLKLQAAEQTLQAEMLQMEYDVCRLCFDIIVAQTNEQLAAVNLQNTVTNLAIEKRRVQLGVSTEDKTLQLEIQQINSQQQQASAQLSIRQAVLSLRAFINTADTSINKIWLPEQLPVILIDKEKMLATAKQNLPLYLSFQQKKSEAESKIAEAKAEGRRIDLTASYGLNSAAADIPAIYRNPQDQQRFSIGFNIPISDWGKRKNNIAVANLQKEQVELSYKLEETKFVTDITNLTNELPVLQHNVIQALLLDSLSQKRFSITNRLFQSGKTGLLELQAAQTEKDNAKRNYIGSLRRFWETYYLLKAKTIGSF